MAKLNIIKNHNENMRNAIKTCNNHKWVDLYERENAFGGDRDEKSYIIINSVPKIFHASKNILKSYRNLVCDYNILMECINKYHEHIQQDEAIIKAALKRKNELEEQKNKMLLMCEKLPKPDNFDYCMHLLNEKQKCENDAKAVKMITISPEHKQEKTNSKTTYESHSSFIPISTPSGMIPIPTSSTIPTTEIEHHYETIPAEIAYVADNEKRMVANQQANYVNQEISKQSDFEYCIALKKLYNDYDYLSDIILGMPELIQKKNDEINEFKDNIKNLKLFASKLKSIIASEKGLISANFHKLQANNLIEITEEKEANITEIEDRVIAYTISEKLHANTPHEYSLREWQKKCNKHIKELGANFIEKSKIEKTDELLDLSF